MSYVIYGGGDNGRTGIHGRDGPQGKPGRDGKCECKDIVDKLTDENKLLKKKIAKLETMVEEMYYSAEMKGPGYLAARGHFESSANDSLSGFKRSSIPQSIVDDSTK